MRWRGAASPGSMRLMPGLIRFRERSRADPIRGERKKVETLEWRLKALLPCFLFSCIFCSPNRPSFLLHHFTIHHFTIAGFWWSDRLPSEGNKTFRLCLAQPWYGLVTQNDCSRQSNPFLITNNKYNNQVYVIKLSHH